MSDNLHLVDYLLIDNPFPALKFSGSIGGHWPAITQFPAYWPQCLQKIQKSMATSGLPSIKVFEGISEMFEIFKFICCVC